MIFDGWRLVRRVWLAFLELILTVLLALTVLAALALGFGRH